MKPVREEATGCGIACAAAIAGITYHEAGRIANGMDIFDEDGSLWSDTKPVRRLLSELVISTGSEDAPFENWESLPDCSLLSDEWHVQVGMSFWHWGGVRESGGMRYVLD
ncbi:MAG: hypothetical protein ACU833_12825 [Gammaproteobacteria bacterium]